MKKFLCLLLASAMCAGMVVTAAAANSTTLTATAGVKAYDDDGDLITTVDSGLSADVEFDKDLYLSITDLFADQGLNVADVDDKDLVSFSAKKNEGSKYIEKISLVTEKKLDNLSGRDSYIKVTTKDSMALDEEKVQFTIKFKVKKDDALEIGSGKSDEYEAKFTLWVSNPVVSDSLDTGDRGIYKPEKNDENEIVWAGADGDVAMLRFDSDDDSDKMFIKLSTKSIEDVYVRYGDPVDADLYFRSFAGTPTIPSTSRASLFLYNPWADSDDDVNINRVRIYSYDKGEVTDVTELFKWDSEEEAWVTKTRTLGSYIISDKELDIEEEIDDPEIIDPSDDTSISTPEENTKPVPNTGRWA